MNNTHQNFFFLPPSHTKIKKMSNFEPLLNKKNMANLHFVSCLYEGEFCGHFGFFHSNLLVSNFYFWSTKLTQINHTIINIFSGILIVAVTI